MADTKHACLHLRNPESSPLQFANPLASPAIKDSMASMFSTSGWTNADWSAYSEFLATIDTVVAAVLIFIGLYAGSMLKKPKNP